MNKKDIDMFIKKLTREKYFAKATHNSYAYRFRDTSGIIIEGKNDDGETGAGMCILRELQRMDYINGIIVVTRYFGGIHLGADRFKNIINASKNILKQIK